MDRSLIPDRPLASRPAHGVVAVKKGCKAGPGRRHVSRKGSDARGRWYVPDRAQLPILRLIAFLHDHRKMDFREISDALETLLARREGRSVRPNKLGGGPQRRRRRIWHTSYCHKAYRVWHDELKLHRPAHNMPVGSRGLPPRDDPDGA